MNDEKDIPIILKSLQHKLSHQNLTEKENFLADTYSKIFGIDFEMGKYGIHNILINTNFLNVMKGDNIPYSPDENSDYHELSHSERIFLFKRLLKFRARSIYNALLKFCDKNSNLFLRWLSGRENYFDQSITITELIEAFMEVLPTAGTVHECLHVWDNQPALSEFFHGVIFFSPREELVLFPDDRLVMHSFIIALSSGSRLLCEKIVENNAYLINLLNSEPPENIVKIMLNLINLVQYNLEVIKLFIKCCKKRPILDALQKSILELKNEHPTNIKYSKIHQLFLSLLSDTTTLSLTISSSSSPDEREELLRIKR